MYTYTYIDTLYTHIYICTHMCMPITNVYMLGLQFSTP